MRLALEAPLNPVVLRYINRLSDLLFVLARFLNGKGAEDVRLGSRASIARASGMVAFSTWPPELCIGRMFSLTASFYMPPVPPPGVTNRPSGATPILGEYFEANILRQDYLMTRATKNLNPFHSETPESWHCFDSESVADHDAAPGLRLATRKGSSFACSV